MIVATMDNMAIRSSLIKDEPKIVIRANMLNSKVIKHFSQQRQFPAYYVDSYKHQTSGNRYLIFFCAYSKNHLTKPEVMYALDTTDDTGRVLVTWDTSIYPSEERGNIECQCLYYYGNHFFIRYRERIWPGVDLSFDELACRFFFRNRNRVPVILNEEILTKYKKYGVLAKFGYRVHDGLCLTQMWQERKGDIKPEPDEESLIVCSYKTIINPSILKEGQKEALDEEVKRMFKIQIKAGLVSPAK